MTPDPLKFLPKEGKTMVQAGRHLVMPRNHVCILLCGYVVKKVERHRFDSWRFYPLGLWFFCLELLPEHQNLEQSLQLKAGGGGSSPRLISRQGGQGGSEGWSRGMEQAEMKRCQQEELRRCSEFSTKWMNSALCTGLAPWQRVTGLEWGLEDTAVMMWMSPPTLLLRFNWHADDIRKWLAMIGSRLMPWLKYCVSLTNFNMLAFHPLPRDTSVWMPLLNVIAMPLDFLPEIHYNYTT